MEDKTECPAVGSPWEDIRDWSEGVLTKDGDYLDEVIYQTLDCGGAAITRKFLVHVLWMIKTFDRKQQNYGPENIAQLGEEGIMSRIKDDKFSRLKTLLKNPEAALEGEPALDAWYDSSVYGLIGAMVRVGDWPTCEELGINARPLLQICREAVEMAATGSTPADALKYIEENLPR